MSSRRAFASKAVSRGAFGVDDDDDDVAEAAAAASIGRKGWQGLLSPSSLATPGILYCASPFGSSFQLSLPASLGRWRGVGGAGGVQVEGIMKKKKRRGRS